MWQQLIVACIVLAAVLHAAAKYLPASWRRRLVQFLTRRGAPESRMAAWLKTKPGCGDGCSSCGSCSTAPPVPDGARPVIELHVQRPK